MKVKHVALLLAIMWIGTLALAGQDPSGMVKTGKESKFTLDQQVQAASVTLHPGRPYLVQHKVVGNDHFLRFVDASTSGVENIQWGPTDVGVIKCRVEPLGKTATETEIFTEKQADGLHITRVEIAGESDAHYLLR